MTSSTTSAEFFDHKYRDAADPWDFAHSTYEQSRYHALLAALDKPRYLRAFEPGCSIGELTHSLAQRCDHVDAIDISPTAIARAKLRCHNLANVDLQSGDLLHHMPHGAFDLIVFSEIGYYFEEDILHQVATMLIDRLSTSGTLLAAHWLGASSDHILSGDRVHEILRSLPGLRLTLAERHSAFRLDRWERI
jgi:SAM-dependent methyltransferase